MRNWQPNLRLRSSILVATLVTIPLVPLKLNPRLPQPQREAPEAQSTIAAPDADFEPIFTQTIPSPIDMAPMFPANPQEQYLLELPRYRSVPCGDIDDDVCFEICAFDKCFVYGNDDGRVLRFIEMVERVKELEQQLEVLRQQKIAAIIDAAGSCINAGAAAVGVKLALIAAKVPELTWSKVASILFFAGAGLFCIGSIYSAWQVEETKQEQVRGNIDKAREDAIFEFNILEQNPPG